MSEPLADCECGRGPVSVVAFPRNTSLLVRRIEDMGYASAADWRCVDCVADMADEVAASPMPSSHPDAPALRPASPESGQVAVNTHWNVSQFSTTDEAQKAASFGDGLIHAAASAADDYALCEPDGPHLGGAPDYVRLNLDTPRANELRDTVTCLGCLERMHAWTTTEPTPDTPPHPASRESEQAAAGAGSS